MLYFNKLYKFYKLEKHFCVIEHYIYIFIYFLYVKKGKKKF